MNSFDMMRSASENQEYSDYSDSEPAADELLEIPNTGTTKNEEKFFDGNFFKQFKRFKEEATLSFDSETMKKRLKQSISLWHELLNMANHANEKNKNDFDLNRILVVKVFSDINETDLFNNDKEFSRQTFFGYLDLLNTLEIQQFLTALSLSTIADSIRESNIYIILFNLTVLCKFVHFVDDGLDDKYNSLFNAMRIHVEQKLQNTMPQKSTKAVHQRILSLIWNLSDHTVTVPSLLRAGFGKSVLEWLNNPTLTDIGRRPMVSIVHNLSRHDDGADELNKYGAIETINRIQQLVSVRQSKMTLINTMSLALLSTPEQIKADPTGTKTILNQLLQITMNASTAERYRYNGFHVSEPLAVLVKLFVDDATFDYVMNQAETDPPSNPTSTIKLFSDLLIRFHVVLTEKHRLDQFTFIALFNILWSISFHDVYHDILKQNTELIETIKNVAQNSNQIIIEQYVPRSMQSVKKAADGILFNLGLETPPIMAPIFQRITTQQKPLIMISYSHANNDFCDRILELLDQKTDLFDIWIDKRCCKSSDDVWESIAKGIKNAQLIICIVSTEYLASKACRQEIIYAKDRLNKRFLPVYLEKPDISDWLDIRLAEFKYVRFQNTYLYLDERKVEEFLSTVIESISPGYLSQTNMDIKHHDTPPTHHKPIKNEITTSSSIEEIMDNRTKSVRTWTQRDIHHWFAQQNISEEIRDMYQFKTGAQMITYAECLKDGWQKQYERYASLYAQRYAGKELLEHEFALFVSALKQLSIDSVPRNNSTKQKVSNGRASMITEPSQKSCFCVLL